MVEQQAYAMIGRSFPKNYVIGIRYSQRPTLENPCREVSSGMETQIRKRLEWGNSMAVEELDFLQREETENILRMVNSIVTSVANQN